MRSELPGRPAVGRWEARRYPPGASLQLAFAQVKAHFCGLSRERVRGRQFNALGHGAVSASNLWRQPVEMG